MRLFIIILTNAFCFISITSFAVEMTGLYAAEQRVATQDESARDAVAGKALAAVLLKLVGDRAQLDRISADDIAAIAPELLEQHTYFNANAAKAVHDNTAPEQLAVRLQFDAIKVKQQLSDWGLSVWDAERPEVLLLLVRDDGGNKEILADGNTLAQFALEKAISRGVPVLLPLMDLVDYQGLNIASLWAGDFDATAAFVSRYQIPLVVTARMASQGNGQWQIQWQYNLAGTVRHWQSTGDIAQAIQLGMDTLADNVAQQFSHEKTAVAQHFVLEIEDVLGFVPHQKVMRFLDGLNYADQVQQHALIDGVLTVSLDYFGDKQALLSAISGGQLLLPLSDIVGADRLFYRVRP